MLGISHARNAPSTEGKGVGGGWKEYYTYGMEMNTAGSREAY